MRRPVGRCVLCDTDIWRRGRFGEHCWRCEGKWVSAIELRQLSEKEYEWRRLSEKEQEARGLRFLDEINTIRAVREEIGKLGLDPESKSCLYCGKRCVEFMDDGCLCLNCSQEWFGGPSKRRSMSQEENDKIWAKILEVIRTRKEENDRIRAKVLEAVRIKEARDSGNSLLDDYFGGEASSQHST